MDSTDSTKGHLVALLSDGDCEGHNLMYTEYAPVIYGAINAIVKDAVTADKLLKQTFSNICSNINQYNALNCSFLTWALQVARSISVDYLKNSNQRIQPEFIISASISEDFMHQHVFEMILQGYKAPEIAQKLNIPVETVKINIRKAMRQKNKGI